MSTIRRALKNLLLRLGDAVVRRFVPEARFVRLRRSLYVQLLSLRDSPAAAAEFARDMGVTVGRNCRFYGVDWGHEPFLVEIGDDVLVAFGVRFVNHDSGVYVFRHEAEDVVNNFGRIRIGDNCFIGINAMIMPNVQIGRNCIVAAGAVVMNSFSDDCVIMGNPAKTVFPTSFYREMKLFSELTVRNQIAFPEFDFLPEDERKRIILAQIGSVPIRPPHLHRKGRAAH